MELLTTKRFEEMVNVLKELGMTTTGARIYLTLLRSNNATAKRVSQLSGVPRPDTYRILSHLESEGFVSTVLGRPKKFLAISPKDCVSILSRRRKEKLVYLKEEALSQIQLLRKEKQEKSSQIDEFVIISNREILYSKGREMIDNAKKCICILGTNQKVQAFIFSERQAIEKALSRKVDFKLMLESIETSKPAVLPEEFHKYPNFSVLFSSEPAKASFGVYDRKEILLSSSIEDVAHKYSSIWSTNKSLVSLAQDYFDLAWRFTKEKPKHLVP